MKRPIALLISLILILSTLPLSAIKVSASPFAGGDGSAGNPYLVASPEALNAVRDYPKAHYMQTADIDMSAWGNWIPIENFSGVYDGRDFYIKNVTIEYSYKVSEATPYGLFATAQGASFKNIRLTDLNINIDESQTDYEAIYKAGLEAGLVVGGICADVGNPISDYNQQSYTLFENCEVSGNIKIVNCANLTVGAIVGRGFADISYCNNFANITVNANRVYAKDNLYNLARVNCGGICGKIDNLNHNDLYSKSTRYCSNSGKIEVWAGGYTSVSGIGTSFNIRECVNFGNIFASALEDQPHRYCTHYVGGISATGGVSSCVNYGIISGYGKKIGNDRSSVNVGGICGRGRAEGCYNLSQSVSAQYFDQYNITEYATFAGRICGEKYYDSQNDIAFSYSSVKTKVNNVVPEPHTYDSSNYGQNYNYQNGFDIQNEQLLIEKTYALDFKNTWTIDPSIGGPVLRDISFVTDDKVPVIEKLDFAEFKYRADYLLSVTLNDSTFSTILTSNEYNPAKIIVDSHPKGMNTAAAAWDTMSKAIATANEGPGNLMKDEITQSNLIVSYIMQALKYQTQEIVADAVKTAASDVDGFVKFSDFIVNGMENPGTDFTSHAKSHSEDIKNVLLEQSEKNNSQMKKLLLAKEFAALFNTLAELSKSYTDLYNRINSYAMLYASAEETKAVINSMYDLCPASDKEVKKALSRVKTIMDAASEKLLQDLINKEIVFTTSSSSCAIMTDILWESISSVLETSFPGVSALCKLANAEMYVVDKFFGVNKSVEQYFKLCTIADLDSLTGKAVEKAIENYKNNKTTENAKILISAIELKLGFIKESYRESIGYAEIIDDEGIVRSAIKALKLFLNVYENSLKNSLQNGVVLINEFHKSILTSWIYQLEYDYPEIAPLYEEYKNGINKSFAAKQYSIHCPVNVKIYNASGETVAEVGENAINACDNIAVIYDHGEKEIYFFDNADYTLVCEGYEDGDMDIELKEFDSNGALVRTVGYNNVPVSLGSVHTLSEEKLDDGDGAIIFADFDSAKDSEKYKITIKNGTISGYFFEYEASAGERIEICAIVPDGYLFVGWQGNVEFEDAKSSSTYFFMKDGDVSVSAKLKRIESEDDDSETPDSSTIIVIVIIAGAALITVAVITIFIVISKGKKNSKKE